MENRRGSGSTVTKVFNRELSEGFFYFFYFDGITALKQDRNVTFLWYSSTASFLPCTLASGIDVGSTFINFGFFSRPYGLIREYIKVI